MDKLKYRKVEYLKDFILKQKCISWRLQSSFFYIKDRIINKIKNSFGILYDSKFFDSEFRQRLKKANVVPIVSSLVEKYVPRSVIDIGCGDGVYLEIFIKKGVVEALGCDNSREGIKRSLKKGLNIKKLNIVKDKSNLTKRYDLAICFEVAEHLPQYSSRKLVELLCSCSDTVVFTAAPPGQTGDNHINEQPYEFWIDKFDELGYSLDKSDMKYLKNKWFKNNVVSYMVNNLMIFKSGKLGC